MKGALAGAFSTWLALTGLQALTTRSAPGRVSSLFADANSILERVLDPTVAAIPDRRAGASSSSGTAKNDRESGATRNVPPKTRRNA